MAEKYETFPIDGHIQKMDGSLFTLEEDRLLLDAFLDWLAEQNLGFGGALGNPEPKKSEQDRG